MTLADKINWLNNLRAEGVSLGLKDNDFMILDSIIKTFETLKWLKDAFEGNIL